MGAHKMKNFRLIQKSIKRIHALHHFTFRGNYFAVNYLAGYYPYLCLTPDRYGRLPIHYAAFFDKHSIFTILYNHCPESLDVKDEWGQTPIQVAGKKIKQMFQFKKRVYFDYHPVKIHQVPQEYVHYNRRYVKKREYK